MNFCSTCGSAFKADIWPRECTNCKSWFYRNPRPISVIIVPMFVPAVSKMGVLLGKRGREPGQGLWGLPGGWMELGETVEEAATRELREETQLSLEPHEVAITHSFKNPAHGQVLIFNEFIGRLRLGASLALRGFIPDDETTELKIATEVEPLAFPSHTDALERWFERQR